MVECPTCGKRGFDNQRSMRIHHKHAHGATLVSDVTLQCEFCDSEYTVEEHREDESRFCSNDCMTKWQSENRTGEAAPNWKGGKETLVCNSCGEEFKVIPARAEEQQFCSPECTRNRVEKVCGYCGEIFDVAKSRADEARFCSYDCRGAWQSEALTRENNPNWVDRVTLECEMCGDEYEVRPPEEERSRFCSKDCLSAWMSKNQTGEDHPSWTGYDIGAYGTGWNVKKKEAVRERDNRECQHCGRSEEEHIRKFGVRHSVHHITPANEIDGSERRNAMENLITLCRGECHALWERMAPLRPDTRV